MTDHVFPEPEHHMLRDQLRRYIDDRIKPAAEAWETDGMVPREVLREMGGLGFVGARYPDNFGAMATGEAQAATDLKFDDVKNRIAFGEPLWKKQAIRQRLSMLAARVAPARSFVCQLDARDAAGEKVLRQIPCSRPCATPVSMMSSTSFNVC